MSHGVVVVERESGEVYLFEDTDKAEAYLEPIDVENGEYDAFGSDGAILTLDVAMKSGREFVHVARDPISTSSAVALRSKLKRYFSARNEWRSEYDSMDLPALVARLTERFAR